MRRICQRRPDHILGAEEALFIAMEDPQTACFLKTAFTIPEQKPEIITERCVTKGTSCYYCLVFFIEKPLPALRANLPLLNIAHIVVDALEGKILRRWFLKGVFYEEYQELKRRVFALHEDCKGQNP